MTIDSKIAELAVWLGDAFQNYELVAKNQPYPSRHDIEIATIPAEIVQIEILGVGVFVSDPTGTALTSADGRKWSPAGAPTPQHFGALCDGVTDDTLAIQAAIDFGFSSGRDVHIPAGVYSTSGLRVYGIWSDNMHGNTLAGVRTKIIFSPNSVLKLRPGTVFGIRTWESPGAAKITDEVMHGWLESPTIDMAEGGRVGILLECAHYWRVENADIRNVPAGSFSYADGHVSGAQTYPRTGLMIKGITGVAGSYSNRIVNPFIRGAGPSAKGGRAIWIGTTLGQNDQRANFNFIEQGAYTNCEIGIDIEQGFNQTLQSPNIYGNTKNLRVNTGRNLIEKPYMESGDIGIEFTSNSGFNVLYSTSSIASAVSPYIDNGVDNVMFPEDYLPRFCSVDAVNGPGVQVIPSNTWTKVDFSRVTSDQRNMVNLALGRVVVDANGNGEGAYLFTGAVRITCHAGKSYDLAFYKNGVESLASRQTAIPAADSVISIQATATVYLKKNDYVEMFIRHNHTSDETITSNGNTGFSAVKQGTKIGIPFNQR